MPTVIILSRRALVGMEGAYLKLREYSEGPALLYAPYKRPMMTVCYGWTRDVHAVR